MFASTSRRTLQWIEYVLTIIASLTGMLIGKALYSPRSLTDSLLIFAGVIVVSILLWRGIFPAPQIGALYTKHLASMQLPSELVDQFKGGGVRIFIGCLWGTVFTALIRPEIAQPIKQILAALYVGLALYILRDTWKSES